MTIDATTTDRPGAVRGWMTENVGVIQVTAGAGTNCAEVHERFLAQLARFNQDAAAEAIVVSGAEDAFLGDGGSERFAAEFEAIFKTPKPTVAAMSGAIPIGGLEVALACDLRVSSEDARFLVGFGSTPAGATPAIQDLLPRVAGFGWARLMAFSNRSVNAQRALRIGLVDEVAPAGLLLERAIATAADLAAGSRTIVSRTRGRQRHSVSLRPRQTACNSR